MWRVSSASVGYLNEAARNLQLKYSAVLTGTTERKPRWEECTDLVSGRYTQNQISFQFLSTIR
jgi:predicted metalloendopeptidase